jgi:hypothetical protein
MILRLLNATLPLIQNRYTDFAERFLNGNAAHRTSVPCSIESMGDWSLHTAS